MSGTNGDVTTFRSVIDARRDDLGLTLQRLAQQAGFNSTQALQGKLAGRTGFKVPEVARLADVLGMDAAELLAVLWPELTDASPIIAEAAGKGRAGKRGRSMRRPSPDPEPEGP